MAVQSPQAVDDIQLGDDAPVRVHVGPPVGCEVNVSRRQPQ